MPKTYEPIATNTLGSAAASVTFSSIPATYTDLIVVIAGTLTTGSDNVSFRLNGDSGTNYSVTVLTGDGSTATSGRASTITDGGRMALDTTQGVCTYHFMNYSNTTTYKTVLGRTGTATYGVRTGVSLWRNTAAVSSIVLLPLSYTFNTGTVLTLYGIKSA